MARIHRVYFRRSFLPAAVVVACLGAAYALNSQHFLYLKLYRHEPDRLADHELGYVPVDPSRPLPKAGKNLCYVRVLGELPRFTVERLVSVLSSRGLQGVDLSAQSAFSDQDCAALAAMTSLHYLNLTNTVVSDAGLGALRRLSDLNVLRAGERMTDAAMTIIGGYHRLNVLDLMQTSITDTGLPGIFHLPLRRLELGRFITDDGLRSLAPLHKLRHLDLSQTEITVAGVSALKAFPRLETLLAPHRWNSEALIDLTELPDLRGSLRRLDFSNTDINDHAMGLLVLFKNLEELALSGTAAGDAAIRRLAHMPHLRALELSDTLMTGAGLAELRTLPELQVLSISISNHLTAADLRPLREMKKLRLLIVNGHPIEGTRLNTLMTKLHALDSKSGGSQRPGENSSDFIAQLGSPLPTLGLHRLDALAENAPVPPDEVFRFMEST